MKKFPILAALLLAFAILTASPASARAQEVAQDAGDGVVTYRALLVAANGGGDLARFTKDAERFGQTLRRLRTPAGDDIAEIALVNDLVMKQDLRDAVEAAFAGADGDDVNVYLHVGHGGADPDFGEESIQISNRGGYTKTGELAGMLSAIPGTHLVFLHACHSGGAIAKSLPSRSLAEAFGAAATSRPAAPKATAPSGVAAMADDRFLVFCSSSALEPSWSTVGGSDDGSLFLKRVRRGLGTEASPVIEGLPPSAGEVRADGDRDGIVTFDELSSYVSTYPFLGSRPQTYPARSGLPLFSYREESRRPVFTDISLSPRKGSSFTLEFDATIPKEEIEVSAPHFVNGVEARGLEVRPLGGTRFRATFDAGAFFGKGRTVDFTFLITDAVTSETEEVRAYYRTFEAVPSVTLPDTGNQPSVITPGGQEYRIAVERDYDCTLDVGVYDGDGVLVRNLAGSSGLDGSPLIRAFYYWDGLDDDGWLVPPGTGYTVRVTPRNEAGEGATVEKALPEVCAPEERPLRIAQGGSLKLSVGDVSDLFCTPSYVPLSWESSDEGVAAVSPAGTVEAKALGEAVITATAQDGVGRGASVAVTVAHVPVEGVVMDREDLTLGGPLKSLGLGAALYPSVLPTHATDKTLTWTSSDPAVVRVDGRGRVFSLAYGSATVTATTRDGNRTASCTVHVPAPVRRLTVVGASGQGDYAAGTLVEVSAVPTFGGRRFVRWTADDPGVVFADPRSPKTTLTMPDRHVRVEPLYEEIVVEGVSLDRISLTLEAGESAVLTATVLPGDAADRYVEWSSSDLSVAFPFPDGRVSARAPGTAEVTATARNGRKAICTVTVTAPEAPKPEEPKPEKPAPAVPAKAQFGYSLARKTYDGGAQGVAVRPKAGVGAVTAVYYDGSKAAPRNAGSYAVTADVAKGTRYGAAAGIALGTFTIAKADVSKARITVADAVWSGRRIRPARLTYNKTSFATKTCASTVGYGANRDVGKGTVTITGKGNFTGRKTLAFKILPKKMSAPANAVAGKNQVKVSWRKSSKAQKTTGYRLRWRAVGTKAWSRERSYKASASSATVKGLKKGKRYEFQVRACRTVSKTSYYGAWSRVATSAKILATAPPAETLATEPSRPPAKTPVAGVRAAGVAETPAASLEVPPTAPSARRTVVFDARGGSPANSTVRVPPGGTVPEPDDPEKEGAAFGHWYADDPDVPWDFDTLPEADTTLHAYWILDLDIDLGGEYAAYATASSISLDPGYEVAKALDGDMQTRWASEDGNGSGSVVFTVPFGPADGRQTRYFDHVALTARNESVDGAQPPGGYEISYLRPGTDASDDANWVPFLKDEKNGPLPDGAEAVFADFGRVRADGVRIRMDGTHVATLSDFRIYCHDATYGRSEGGTRRTFVDAS